MSEIWFDDDSFEEARGPEMTAVTKQRYEYLQRKDAE